MQVESIKALIHDEDTGDVLAVMAVPSEGKAVLLIQDGADQEVGTIMLNVEAAKSLREVLTLFIDGADE